MTQRPLALLRKSISFAAFALLAGALAASSAQAQISGATGSTTGSSCSGGNDADGFCAFSRSTTANTGTTLSSRYAWNVNADIGVGSTRDESSNAQHNLSFSATAPGGYRLDITTSRVGMVQRNSDIINCDGQAHTSGVTGSSNIALSSGTLSTSSPADVGNGGGDNQIGYGPLSTSATIFRESNGVAQSHSLTFTWNGSVRSNSCEAAVRQGEQNGSTTDCGACDYAGTPARTQSDDGHFVTVTFTSLCGNGTVESAAGEQCDQGAANGTSTSCCTSQCDFRGAGQVCRPQNGACDVQETCSGSSATCPGDGFASSSTVCRGSAGACDVAENCTGSGPNCPSNAFQPSTTVCRGASGVCDVAENCTGSSAACPSDGVQPTTAVCRPSADLCDAAETCDGVSKTCPADAVAPPTTVCRPSAGPCDSAENCDGSSTACGPDNFLNGSLCRAAAGVCDLAETCDGTGPGCPANALAPGGTECRAAAGVCDVAESCTGVDVDCPADAVRPTTTVCRPAAGVCDIAENCDGSSTSCPADVTSPDADGDTLCDQIDNCPNDPNLAQADADGDGLGDTCDPCTNVGGQRNALNRRIILQKILLPLGDDKLTMKGQVTVPTTPAINPVANGVRVILENADPATLLDVVVPGGTYNPVTHTGWRPNPTNTRWVYKGGSPTPANPISGITVSTSPRTPGVYKFAVRGKNGSFPTTPSDTPLRGTFVIDQPTADTGQCSEITFSSPAACKFNRTFSQVTCR
ncbi:MAG TPA: hypothetical protein VFD92_00130 [Candidatus Binatia bacterium]|nr:hypothetical protein [Candidatus Binatia bacterium]